MFSLLFSGGGKLAYYANWASRWQRLRRQLLRVAGFPAAWMEVSAPLPEGRQQEDEEAVDLQTPQQHAERQDQLANGMDEGVIIDRAHVAESRTD